MLEKYWMLEEVHSQPCGSVCFSAAQPGARFAWKWKHDGGSPCVLAGSEWQRTLSYSGPLKSPPRFSPIWGFQKHAVFYLCALRKDYSIYSISWHMPYTIWCKACRGRVENMDTNYNLAQFMWCNETGCDNVHNQASISGYNWFCRVNRGNRTVVV